jgi:urocanate hydratase
MNDVPDRVSDAGPEETKPRDEYEWIEEAMETAHKALRFRNDSIKLERSKRIDLLGDAIEALDNARRILAERAGLTEAESQALFTQIGRAK